jgi:hypothetical protein
MIWAEILHEAGVPAGVFNLVNGSGSASKPSDARVWKRCLARIMSVLIDIRVDKGHYSVHENVNCSG